LLIAQPGVTYRNQDAAMMVMAFVRPVASPPWLRYSPAHPQRRCLRIFTAGSNPHREALGSFIGYLAFSLPAGDFFA